jgi:hypothetical protein
MHGNYLFLLYAFYPIVSKMNGQTGVEEVERRRTNDLVIMDQASGWSAGILKTNSRQIVRNS